MCDSSHEIDRRTALIGAGCLALGGLLPGTAAGQGAGQRQSPIDFRPFGLTYRDRLPRLAFDYPESNRRDAREHRLAG
jgi:hypothetical protein